jgi:hypothetical protein
VHGHDHLYDSKGERSRLDSFSLEEGELPVYTEDGDEQAPPPPAPLLSGGARLGAARRIACQRGARAGAGDPVPNPVGGARPLGHVRGRRRRSLPPPSPSRTKWTRLVHPSVLTGHVRGRRRRPLRPRLRRARPVPSGPEAPPRSARAPPPPLPPVLTGHVSSLPPVLTGRAAQRPRVPPRQWRVCGRGCAGRWALRARRDQVRDP